MSRRDLWRKLYERFDPELPAPPEWRATRTRSLATAMLETLARPFGTPRLLLMGTVGTGKTTELLRVAEAREETDLVVFMDLAQHFAEVVKDPRALERLDAWEVCFLAGLTLVHRFHERLGTELDPEMVRNLGKAWQALAATAGAPAPQLDLGTFTKEALDLGATLAATGALGMEAQGVAIGARTIKSVVSGLRNWTLPLGRNEKVLPDQDRHVQELLSAVNVLIGEVQAKYKKVLLVIDGLDRIRDLTRAKALFVDSQLLSQLPCPLVVCGPAALRHHLATAGIQSAFKRMPLVNEPVLDHTHPERPGPGIGFFRELYARRVSDLGPAAQDMVSEAHLNTLAYRSGGRSRDFVRFIRSLSELAWDKDVASATPDLVKQVLDEWRLRQETGLNKDHIRLLEDVARDPEHRLPAGSLAYELLDYQHLLPYPNDSEWYYPHPLLTMHLVQTSPAGSVG
ncbi:hypothetical protein [Archangium primigenium]|uniref:hypothetical protein n=1 Tax=[Archangium] primigenium TaxID=2792470 RepID=UPI00195D994B|nr:hypothetical protein [Archangium primigenium]MBM7112598.1 hypothetical protein [Archangium primigenium]